MKHKHRRLTLTRGEIEAVLSALSIFTVEQPVVPNLEVYYSAVAKLEQAVSH